MVTRLQVLSAILFVAWALGAGLAQAQDVAPPSAQGLPALTGRVVDDAGLMDPATRAGLESELRALERGAPARIVVATVASLKGEGLPAFANRLAAAWKLGEDGPDRGVLLCSRGRRSSSSS